MEEARVETDFCACLIRQIPGKIHKHISASSFDRILEFLFESDPNMMWSDNIQSMKLLNCPWLTNLFYVLMTRQNISI